jgi:Arc/MetJ-type ribon-helix-helix transcriptional regulator
MSEIALASINTLPSTARQAGFESPSELITLTLGQLSEMVRAAIRPLQERVEALESTVESQEKELAAMGLKMASLENLQEQDTNRICLDIAYDRRRLTALEHPAKEPGKTDLSRAEKIEKYLTARPDRKATFETLRGHLDVDKFALNDAIRTLMEAYPGRYGIIRAPGDKRKRALIMLPR